MFRGSVKSTGYPFHSPVSPSLPLPCVIMCHHISTGLYFLRVRTSIFQTRPYAPLCSESHGPKYCGIILVKVFATFLSNSSLLRQRCAATCPLIMSAEALAYMIRLAKSDGQVSGAGGAGDPWSFQRPGKIFLKISCTVRVLHCPRSHNLQESSSLSCVIYHTSDISA